jgi:hypothetical protein
MSTGRRDFAGTCGKSLRRFLFVVSRIVVFRCFFFVLFTPCLNPFVVENDQRAVCLFGGGVGSGGSTLLSSVDVVDLQTGLWSTASLRQPRYDLAATSVKDIALFGGGRILSGAVNTVDIYNLTSDSWTVGNLSLARFCFVAFLCWFFSVF